MNKLSKRSQLFFSLLLATLFTSAFAQKPTVIRPGEIWPDTDGNHIQAHGGGITQIKDTYYWYGEARAQDQDPDKRYVLLLIQRSDELEIRRQCAGNVQSRYSCFKQGLGATESLL